MKRKITRILAALLALLMTLGMLAACGKEPGGDETGGPVTLPAQETMPAQQLELALRRMEYSMLCAALSAAKQTETLEGRAYRGDTAYIADLDRLNGADAIPTFYAAKSIIGPIGLVLMAVAAIASILTCMIAGYRATARILSTMAEDRILSKKFNETTNSIVFIMLISIVLSVFGRTALECFIDLTAFGAIVGFGYTSASAWKLARKLGNRKAMATGALGTIVSAVFAVAQLIPKLTVVETMGAEAFLVLSLWCLLGFMFYLRIVNRSSAADFSNPAASSVAIFALLLYSVLMWLGKRLMAAENIQTVRDTLVFEGSLMLLVIFIGLCVMMYIQHVARQKHAALHRDLARAAQKPHNDPPSGPDAG